MATALHKMVFRCVAFLVAFAVAFLLFAGLTVVFGTWNEPLAQPPASSIGAPVTASLDAFQAKSGKLRVDDLFLDDVNRWLTDTVQFLPLAPSNVAALTSYSPSNPNPALLNWTAITVTPSGMPAGAVVTGLELNAICGEAFAWITPEVPPSANPPLNPDFVTGNIPFNQLLENSPNTYTWRLACAARDDDGDSQTVFVPISSANQPVPGGPVTIRYRAYATDPSTVGVRIDLAGVYYHY